jgi:tetratricopeptide (TPR) repeat protein
VQQLFEKLGYFPDLTEAIAAKLRDATSKVPEKVLFEELERVSQFWTDATQLSAALSDALDQFNWTEANNICSGVVARCRDAAIPFPAAPARQMLNSLRRKRQFALMETLGAAFAAGMPDNLQVQRLYAQALADQSKFSEAEAVLRNILAQTPPLAEEAEAKGLLGRIEKQRYVDAPTAAGAGDHLLNSIRIYLEAYQSNPTVNLWHGINSAALIARAERDGFPIFEFPDSVALAKDVLATETSRDDLYAWDYATMMEAALAIGDYGAAELNLNRYISDPSCDAFELGSTLRQLRQIWQLSAEQGPGATLLPKLEAALLQRQGGSLEPTHGELASVVAARGSDRGPVGPDFQQLEWYRTALLRAASVARIETPAVRGTGFLVKATDFFPGASDNAIVLLTAAHVLSEPGSSQPALETASAVFEAQARAFRLGRLLWFSPADQLDAAFLTVEGLAPDAPFCPMPSPSRQSETRPPRVYVIGYPGGGALSFSLQDGLLLDSDATHFHYRAATQPGSGGSPVFDGRDWTLLALHHARSSQMPMLNGKPGFYEAGEGISLRAIQAATRRPSVRTK